MGEDVVMLRILFLIGKAGDAFLYTSSWKEGLPPGDSAIYGIQWTAA